MITALFEITNFIDKARWGNKENYNLINFYRNDLSNDVKILTHWLCYIADRQMAFERVWDVGGFVFSEMADQMTEKRDLDLLNPSCPDKSFFIKRDEYADKSQYDYDEGDNGKYLFVSHQVLTNNEILIKYDFIKGTQPFFISRYYPSDYTSILSTFYILKDYNFSLSRYIVNLLEKTSGRDDFIQRLLFGLFLLSYFDIGQPKSSDLMHFDRNLGKAEKRKNRINKILNDSRVFTDEFDNFKKDVIYKQKRAWCSLRDFLKSPEFKGYFFGALKEIGFADVHIFQPAEILKYLELPGDVWNNNPIFRKCILRGTRYEQSRLLLSKLLRKMFNENRTAIRQGYPEQFDITFDFVPRMCDRKGNCSICPYGLLRNEATEFNKVCINHRGKYCPVMYISCNYKMLCVEIECLLLKRYTENTNNILTPVE
jgi:hypothetical protein